MGVPNKIYSLLGIAMKSGNVVSGEYQTLEAVKKRTANLVLVSEDASDNTKKLFTDKKTIKVSIIFMMSDSHGQSVSNFNVHKTCFCNNNVTAKVYCCLCSI